MSVWELALLLFVVAPMVILWFRTITDIFDRRDLAVGSRGLWLLAVVILPIVGVLAYLFTRPITDQDRGGCDAQQGAARRHQPAPGFSVADEIEKLDGLLTRGVITQDEFTRQRTALLA